MSFKKVIFAIAAYNEEDTILACLKSLNKQKRVLCVRTIICLNGCTDNTLVFVEKAKSLFPKLNIEIISSSKGLNIAQNKIVKHIQEVDIPILFVDADVTLELNAAQIMLSELQRNTQLQAVGSWPIPKKPNKLNLFQKVLFKVLHIRTVSPLIEISAVEVDQFKPYVHKLPQPQLSPEEELKTRIYFHGRAYLLRNKGIYCIPKDRNMGDDVYLPAEIHHRFGSGSTRIRYDALVYYKPYLSLHFHFKSYRRFYSTKKYVHERFPHLNTVRQFEKTKINWNCRKIIGWKNYFFLLCYSSLFFVENLLFKIIPQKKSYQLWSYIKK